MTKDEALDKALNALLWANIEINDWRDDAHGYKPEDQPQIMEAIAAIKQARSAPVQEPVAYIRVSKTGHVMACAETGDFYALAHGTKLYTTPHAAPVQEPVALHPVAKRRVFDAIRGAYDLGYNDARGAQAVHGDSAPGYKGRDVEADHGGALISALERYITPPAAQRQWVGLTDEEIEQEFGFIDELLRDCVHRTEAKLKEKNESHRQHVTDGNPCWCAPETSYTDPETGASVIVHKEPQ
jgi:hypothetical protein